VPCSRAPLCFCQIIHLEINVKTNSILPVSACLAFFKAIWHFFTIGLAFFVHLNLVTLLATSTNSACT